MMNASGVGKSTQPDEDNVLSTAERRFCRPRGVTWARGAKTMEFQRSLSKR